jgi:flagellar FliJ protein
MSAFRFRLATLLRLRLAERDERRSDLENALAVAETLRHERRTLEAQQQDNLALLRRLAAPGSGNVEALLQAHRYEAVLKAHSTQLTEKDTHAEREIQRRRMVLVEADRQVRVLEKLEQRQAAEHQRQADKLEARRLDEVAALGYVRQRWEPANVGQASRLPTDD